jgi:hypothetical protein
LLEIFDRLFGRRIEGAGDSGGRKRLRHYKNTLKSSYVVTSRADAESWAVIHVLVLHITVRFATKIRHFKQTRRQEIVVTHRESEIGLRFERKSGSEMAKI